jgi:hypothetical protein
MHRTARPNPFLESLLPLREVTPHLLMLTSLVEEYSENFFLRDRDRQEEYRMSLNLAPSPVWKVEVTSCRSYAALLRRSRAGSASARPWQLRWRSS